MNYEQAVQKKIARQKDPKQHPFQQSFLIQENYEIHRFLLWAYKKPVEKVVIPTGLCKICNRLKVEHND